MTRDASIFPFLERHLPAADRIGETLCGLIMVLTFTLAAGSAVAGGTTGVRELLIATLGCNVAWGLIDGFLFVMTAMLFRGRHARLMEAVQLAPDDASALDAVRTELEPGLGEIATPPERERFYRAVARGIGTTAPAPIHLERGDVLGFLAIFTVEVLCTVPAALPFLFLDDPWIALRVSNAILLGLLFALGVRWGRLAGAPPILSGLALLLLGAVMVASAIYLGG